MVIFHSCLYVYQGGNTASNIPVTKHVGKDVSRSPTSTGWSWACTVCTLRNSQIQPIFTTRAYPYVRVKNQYRSILYIYIYIMYIDVYTYIYIYIRIYPTANPPIQTAWMTFSFAPEVWQPPQRDRRLGWFFTSWTIGAGDRWRKWWSLDHKLRK